MSIRMPERVRVGPFLYEVRVEDEAFEGDTGGLLCGQADHNNGLIRVMRCSPNRMFVTLWHEMLHAIDDVAGTGLSEDKISRLAPILAGELIDNSYIRSDVTEG